jgi:hypothetical protein
MRIYGRVQIPPTPQTEWTVDNDSITADSNITVDGTSSGAPGTVWFTIETDANGSNDLVYATALAQVLLLNLNESPFYATSGLPQQQSIMQQTAPDYYVTLTQQQYSQYFASLSVTKTAPTAENPTPAYQITALTNQGTIINVSAPIPT